MLSNHNRADIRVILDTQHDLVQRLDTKLSTLETAFAASGQHAHDLAALQQVMDSIEAQADLLAVADLADFDPGHIRGLYAARRAAVSQDLERIDARDWRSLVRSSQQYVLRHGLDPFAGTARATQ
jgi:hypothetical protein